MAQTRVPAQQQRDRDLTGSDEFLTDETLDGLWEWFCNVVNEDKFQSQLIFAKLVNAARKPYRNNISLPQHRDQLFTPDTSHYASSEYTVTPGCIEEQQHLEQSEDKVTLEGLSTKLAIAADSVQTKQTIIKHLEDSMQMKQTIINQLETRIKGMEQELEENKLRHKEEKKQLELDLNKVQQEYLDYKEKGEGDRMQLESKLKEMDQMQQEYKQKAEGEKTQLALNLRNMNLQYGQNKNKIENEKKSLERRLQVLQTEHEKCGPCFVLKSEQHKRFIDFSNGRAVANSVRIPGMMTFTLEKHSNEMVSFRASYPTVYLSTDDRAAQNRSAAALKLSETCGSKEMFWLHEDHQGGQYIEPVDFQGQFLSACPEETYIVLRREKSANELFSFIARR
ncbi:hypothetical protein BDZ91DRAFT_783715 [Kalaharituber pfeilii]|nr:hypothetical protein BDZ91DRAFT_783715 [Kalaharituber pfeilii]